MGQVHEMGNYSGKVLKSIEHHLRSKTAYFLHACRNMQCVTYYMFTFNKQHRTCSYHVGIFNFLRNWKKTRKSFVLWMSSLDTFQLFFIPILRGVILQFHQKLRFTWHQVKSYARQQCIKSFDIFLRGVPLSKF